MRGVGETSRMDTPQHSDWPEWLNSGVVFFGMLFGWIWHAARLATKVDNLETKIDEHLEVANELWKENRESHAAITQKIADVREDIASLDCPPVMRQRKHGWVEE